jgi:hypothetical protein
MTAVFRPLSRFLPLSGSAIYLFWSRLVQVTPRLSSRLAVESVLTRRLVSSVTATERNYARPTLCRLPIPFVAGRIIGWFKDKGFLASHMDGRIFQNADRSNADPRKHGWGTAAVRDILDPLLDIHGLPVRRRRILKDVACHRTGNSQPRAVQANQPARTRTVAWRPTGGKF